MTHRKVRVAVNGYGVIGKRVADAVVAQEDMELVGVADVVTDWRIKVASEKGYPIYASTAQALVEMRAAGIPETDAALGLVREFVAARGLVAA